MGDLTKIGLILSLISGILAVIIGILGLLGSGLEFVTLGALDFGRGSTEGQIVRIVLGVILIMIYQGRIHISDLTVLAIVILVIGLLGGGTLAVLGGILILLDILFVSSGGNYSTQRRVYRA